MPALTPASLGKFCRELACELSPLDVLLDEWNIDDAQYEMLKASPAFKREMQLVLDEMQELGADAGYIYRMKSLAEDQITEVIKIMRDPATGVGTRVDLIKFVAEMARVKEKPQQRLADMGSRGPQVIFQFGAGLPVNSMTVIPQAEPEFVRPTGTGGFDLVPE